MAKEKFKICTFNQVMTPEEAEKAKKSGTPVGQSLREADELYGKRKREG